MHEIICPRNVIQLDFLLVKRMAVSVWLLHKRQCQITFRNTGTSQDMFSAKDE